MGKRQVGEMRVSELVVTLLLSEIAALPISDSNIPFAFAVIPVFLLLSFEVIVPFFTSRHSRLNKIISGAPSLLIKKGKLDQKELSKLRLSVEELLCELRLKNISDIADVEYAILEQNGQMSVFPKAGMTPVTLDDMKLEPQKHGFAHPIVVCGSLNEVNLRLMNKSRHWLDGELTKKEAKIDEVLLFTLDDSGNTTLILKE